MERFFDLFAERQLAADLFTIVEDTAHRRAASTREYGGIRRASRRCSAGELDAPARAARAAPAHRPSSRTWCAPASTASAPWSGPSRSAHPARERHRRALRSAPRRGATVEDAPRPRCCLYDIVEQVPEHPARAARRPRLGRASPRRRCSRCARARRRPAASGDEALDELPDGEESALREPGAGRLPRRLQAGAGPAPDAHAPQADGRGRAKTACRR